MENGAHGENIENQMKYELFDWAQALVTALISIVLIFMFVGRVIGVDGISMLPTLEDGDMVLLQSIFYKPEQGDIVVLTKKTFDDEPIVKRVIATEGQVVDIDFAAHEIRVDGELLIEDYINEPTARSYDVGFPVAVPKGCIFAMGDNRNQSSDSRVSAIGMIDTRCILGKVLMVVMPISRIGTV